MHKYVHIYAVESPCSTLLELSCLVSISCHIHIPCLCSYFIDKMKKGFLKKNGNSYLLSRSAMGSNTL